MPRPGAHVFTIPTPSGITKRFLQGGQWGYPCPHVHVSGRRCGARVAAAKVYCADHQRLDRDDRCAECRAMMAAFGLEVD